MKTSRISILGSGWLGLPLAMDLAESGYHVNLSSRSADKFPSIESINAQPFIVDIDQLIFPSDFFDADILICNITSKNLSGFQSLINVLANSAIQSVLFVSSSSVYRNTQTAVTEDQGVENPDSLLFQIEQVFRACADFSTTILRLSGLIGYQRHPGRFFKNGKVVQQADAPVNLIHRDDCIGIISAIIKQQAWGEVFNGSADTHPSKRVFYSHARALLGEPSPVFDDSGQNQYKIVSNAKIKQQLGYAFIHPDLMQIRFDESE